MIISLCTDAGTRNPGTISPVGSGLFLMINDIWFGEFLLAIAQFPPSDTISLEQLWALACS
jgi:hypothetical protein